MADSHGHAPETTKPRESLFSNIISIIGFIILIVIIVWGLVHLALLARTSIASWLPKHVSTITVTAQNDTMSGNSFDVSWNYTPVTKGSYALIYQCTKGLQLTTNELLVIPCGAAYSLGQATSSSISVTPFLSGTAGVASTISIVFIPSAAGYTQVSGATSVNIHPSSAVATTTNIKTPSVAVNPQTTKPVKTFAADAVVTHGVKSMHRTGPANLIVRIISVDHTNNDEVAVKFDIANVGGASTGSWHFSAQLPTDTNYDYNSPVQASLASGDHILNTLRFTQVSNNGGEFVVTVDSAHEVTESTRRDNTASTYVQGNGYVTQQVQDVIYEPVFDQNSY